MTIQLIIEFAIGLVLLIFLHEFGHFIACKLLGIEVEEFGFGFPPRAVTLFERGGTKFTLNWLPFGGFVRPKGEMDPDVKDGLAGASAWKRITVFLAGPIMNLLTAVVLFIAAYAVMNKLPDRNRVEVNSVVAEFPASQAGIQPGDIIFSIGGVPVHSAETARQEIYSNLGKPLSFVYERDGKLLSAIITPLSVPDPARGAIGVDMTYPWVAFSLFKAVPEGFVSVYDYGNQLVSSLGAIARGQASASEARPMGLKGMFDLYTYVREGPSVPDVPKFASVMIFFAIISFSLGFINLLPIPPMDGGKIIFALPELIIHKRIPVKYEVWVSSIAFLLLIIFMIYINAQDFIHPLSIPTVVPTP